MATRRKPLPAKPPTPLATRTHTGWIRDMERAMRASDFHYLAKQVFSEIIDHTSENARTCWAAMGTMAARLNVSIPTVVKYSKQLEARNAIRRIGKGPKGTIIFEILDGWVNIAIDAMTLRLDKYKEANAVRQAKSRANRKANVTQASLRPDPEMSRNDGFYVSRNNDFDEHLKRTPSRSSSEEGTNAYAIAKGRI